MAKGISRRSALAPAFFILPRHVLGGHGFVAPSDRIRLAAVGMGRQGMAVTMEWLPRPDIQVVAVCDCNEGSRDYIEYGPNALLAQARRLLGPGYEEWGADLASPGFTQVTATFRSSLGMGGREPARRLVEAYYASRQKSGSWRGCAAYRDFRELLEKEKDLDAVYVATPDHWHAPISIAAMRKGKHVFCQKPMAHSIGEARRMAQVARETGVATGLPVNNPTSEATRLISEWIRDGAIGRVREVHNWSNRPYWPQGVDRPPEAMAAPPGLDWDLWLGPAPWRPYHRAYHPFVWRGWYDFGCGSFGDMGCYSFAGLFRILDLTPPAAVEAVTTGSHEETYPPASIVHLDFPAHGDRGPLRITWYEGGLRPPRPRGLSQQDERRFQPRQEGVMYVGDRGIIIGGFNGDNPHVYPESGPHQASSRRPGAGPPDRSVDQWIAACKGGPPSPTNFEAQAPVTEAFLLGCLAQRLPGERLEWDAAAMRVTNFEQANRYVDPPYRSEYAI